MNPEHRAYSVIAIKSVDDDKRVVTGIATTPTVDRAGDVVEPKGAEFKLPIPFLWQHDSRAPIGNVTKAKVTNAGIEVEIRIAKTDEPGLVKDRLDAAWHDIKLGLVRGLSIGFKSVESARIEGTYGLRFIKWLWLELSGVTIPANHEATMQTVKHFDTQQRAASGRAAALPGVSGLSKPKTQGSTTMKTLDERIAAKEAERKTVADKIAAIWKTAEAENREPNDDETVELTDHDDALKEIDKYLVLQRGRKRAEMSAKAVDGASFGGAARSRDVFRVPAEPAVKIEKGIRFARYARCIALAHKGHRDVVNVAHELYGQRDPLIVDMFKGPSPTAVPAMTSGNTSALIGNEGGFADFIEFLRERTILGRFGQGGIPALRGIPFRVPLISQTGRGTAYWTGEGKGKPLTRQTFGRRELAPLKVAVITAATMETLRDSSPSAERMIRDDLAAAIVEREDLSFVDPGNSGSPGIEPASITDDIAAMTVAGSGHFTADEVRQDVRAAMGKFIAAKNPLTTGVWIMSSQTALNLSMMVKELSSDPEFPGLTMNGGTFFGLPVITSEHVTDYVVLVNASDIYLGDEGGIQIDLSTEASLEMVAGDNGGPTQDVAASTLPGTPAPTEVVSMFQTNSVAFRAERTVNWERRRNTAVALITDVEWGATASE